MLKQQRDALRAAMVRGVDQRRVPTRGGHDIGINVGLRQQKFRDGVHVLRGDVVQSCVTPLAMQACG